ncbi:MAG: carbamoyltransferase C-terminal domain-containing protein [Myxococcota bacterium]
MVVLGLNASFGHDPSAALLVDGEVVAAVEQERLSRQKHASGEGCGDAARAVLAQAGLGPQDVDAVAFPWSLEAVEAHRWGFVRRSLLRRPSKALALPFRWRDRGARPLARLEASLRDAGFDPDRTRIEHVPHQLAHAASTVLFSGFDECAVLTIDGGGELTTCSFGSATGGEIDLFHQIERPDSLGLFYSAITDYLGFDVNDGEYKLMGMAAYGDPAQADLSDFLRCQRGDLRLDLRAIWPTKKYRYEGRRFGTALVDRFGPPREGDAAGAPYIHVAAAAQALFERSALDLVEHHLGFILERTRSLCFAGGCALNVKLNRLLRDHPLVDRLFVPPAADDAGTALGAAAVVAQREGETIAPLSTAQLGPSFSNAEVEAVLARRGVAGQRVDDAPAKAAELLAQGEVVAWFQGRMEWGARALGARSILGHPGKLGTADQINARIKFREQWRPFCPSVLAERAPDYLGSVHPSPFMAQAFELPKAWAERTPEVVHVDGTARPQTVHAETLPRYHRLIQEFEQRTGLPCVINTSLNRRGEPIVCTPDEALDMFFGSDLLHLFLEDWYVEKPGG